MNWFKRLFQLRPTPNCAVCKWHKPEWNQCIFQGLKQTIEVYVSPECRALFEKKEEGK